MRRIALSVAAVSAAVLALALSAVGMPAASNLLANPGFELDANADGRPDAWSSNTYFGRTQAAVHSGSFAGAHARTDNNGLTVYQQVAASAGQSYAFSGWVNIPSTSDAFTFVVRVQWRGGSGVINATSVRKFTAATPGWVEATKTLTAPSGTTAARMVMAISNLNATIYVDDFSFGVADGTAPSGSPPTSSGPVNSSPPTVSEAGAERDLHFALPGTWTGSGTITHAYQWVRCDSAGGVCNPIPGAITDRYELTSADLGQRLRVEVTARDAAGSRTVSSALTGVVPARAVPPAGDPVIRAAGDIACDPASSSFNGGNGTATNCRQKATSELLVGQGLTAVLIPGDVQYPGGEYDKFLRSYDPSWGRVNGITFPSPGNHEYHTSGAAGYFAYFGSVAGNPAEGWYSFDIGAWHIVSLNSNCSVVDCTAGSPQEQWLRADLAATSAECTLSYWHHPRFSSGVHGSDTDLDPFWDALYEHGADVVLNGHDHNYERFAPQDPNGIGDPSFGIREFVVGTGGASLRAFPTVQPNSEARNSTVFGVIELTLHASGYDWEFLPISGSTYTDSGSGACHGPPDTGSPPPPPPPPDPGQGQVTAAVETDLVPHANDAADDAAIWIHPTDPSLSTIIGTDKQPGGGLAVYDLAGNEIHYHGGLAMNNVDIRDGFPLGGSTVSLVTATEKAHNAVAIFRVDPETRGLVNVASRLILGDSMSGICMYHNASAGADYAFTTNGNGIVKQWRLSDDGTGLVDATMVRTFDVGGSTEGCVVDDERAHFYVSEEVVGIWRYGAEPDAGTDRQQVASVAAGRLTADVEGLAIAPSSDGGYLVASSQGNDTFVIFDRDDYAHLGTFSIVDSPTIDGVQHTDGIEVATTALGAAFPGGLFVAQDGHNYDGATRMNQNFKLVRWDEALAAAGITP